jgi:superfamily II DNA/RNA helicase
LTVYGGVPIDDQIRELRRGIDIFVGTTGRVLDHIERGNIDFSNLKSVILDEADVMLKLGFKEDVEKVTNNIIHIFIITHFLSFIDNVCY